MSESPHTIDTINGRVPVRLVVSVGEEPDEDGVFPIFVWSKTPNDPLVEAVAGTVDCTVNLDGVTFFNQLAPSTEKHLTAICLAAMVISTMILVFL